MHDLRQLSRIDVNSEIGSCVQGTPVLIQSLEPAPSIRGKRSRAVLSQALTNGFECAIQPYRDTVVLNQLPVSRLNKCASAERHHARVSGFYLLHPRANHLGFQVAKDRFSIA